MQKKLTLLFFSFALLITGCATVQKSDIQIDAEASPKTNFSGYKTYTWLGSAAILNDPVGKWEPLSFDADTEIKFLLDRELRARGMSENSTAPDLIVGFAAGIDMGALALKKDPEADVEILKNVPQGGLVVLLVDSQSGFLIWAGIASAEIQEDIDAAGTKQRLDYAVTQMIKKLPK
ncbi:MAG: DUF4136 domain-containing protein [Pseudomonadales bacterium]|nr:DUF4136 domain-containing protein [Pseudomonadales bacterium]